MGWLRNGPTLHVKGFALLLLLLIGGAYLDPSGSRLRIQQSGPTRYRMVLSRKTNSKIYFVDGLDDPILGQVAFGHWSFSVGEHHISIYWVACLLMTTSFRFARGYRLPGGTQSEGLIRLRIGREYRSERSHLYSDSNGI